MLEDYRREMDKMGPSDAQLARLKTVLSARRETRRRPLRAALIAAATCAALAVSVVAASPDLRARLVNLLGAFAPYAQKVEGASYVSDGIEITVVSAMADGTFVKVYAEARDLEGDRLDESSIICGSIERKDSYTGEGLTGSVAGSKCLAFEESTGTLLLECYTWDMFPSEIPDMSLTIWFSDSENWEIFGRCTIPLNVEVLERNCFQTYVQLNSVELVGFEISPLGLAATTKGENLPPDLACVYLADGSAIRMERSSGGGMFVEGSEYGRLEYWSFPDPVDPDAVVGVSFGYWYVPLKADGTAGEGHWLSELPE